MVYHWYTNGIFVDGWYSAGILSLGYVIFIYVVD